MALNIDGTTGISGVDGSASAPALQGTDSNTGINFASDTVNINTGGVTRATIDSAGALDVPTDFPIKVNGSEKLRLDSSGDIGVGITAPDGRFHIMGGNLSGAGSVTAATDANLLVLESNTSQGLSFLNPNDERATIRFGTTGSDGNLEASISYAHEAVSTSNDRRCMIFKGGGNGERMRIDSIGRLLHGCTSATGGTSEGNITVEFTGNSRNGIKTRDTDNSGSVNHMALVSGSTDIGQIVGTTSSVSYNSASDYRLKENIVAISDGISRLKLLKPSRFNFKVTPDETVDGFLAHEVMSIVPQAVSGTKDAVDSNGKPIHQSMDSAKLVPLLTAALQEAVAKIEVLETKVAALEAG